jgi:phosphopantetheinyl transferase (holo-ACP synthase)
MLRLGPEALDRLRSHRSAPATPVVAAPRASNGDAAPSSNGDAAPSSNGDAAPVPAAGPAAAAPLAADDDEVAVAIAEHLRTMDRFLDAGEDVMRAFLAGAAPVAVEQARRPLVGEIVAWRPGEELVARRTVDPAQDRYLLDHALGRSVSRADPSLSALVVMPLAMSLEIVAEAASCLAADRTVTGLRDVRAHRWLTWTDASQTLEVHARRLGGGPARDEVRVELRSLGEEPGSATPSVEATVVLQDAFPAPPPAAPPPEDGRAPRLAPDRLYEDAMFHAGAWQAVRALDRVAPGGALARLEVLAPGGLLAGEPEPAFVLDPVVLDAAGQVVGLWAAEQLAGAQVVFPFRLAALDLYGPPRAPGEALTCATRTELVGEALVRSDIDVVDAAGHCWMRLTGWEDKRFPVPAHLRPLTVPGALGSLSAPWERPVAAFPAGTVACRRVDTRLPADAGLWERVWAGRVLGRDERERFRELRLPERRRLEWLGARTAAKEAVADLLRAHGGPDLLPADIQILADERGRPQVAVAGLGAEQTPVVSLAHADGEAVALAAPPGPAGTPAIGIDVERLAPRPEGFARTALGDAERRLLEPLGGERAEEWVLRCWCAKEAAGKAAGSGMTPGAEWPAVVAIDPAREQVTVAVGDRRLRAGTCLDGDLVAAVAPSRAAGDEEGS